MITFSLSDLRHICDSATFSLGYDANEASLSEVKSTVMVSDGIMQISAKTQGRKLYKQSINIYTQEEGLKIIGKCSCETARNCKHVISAALAYLDEAAETVEVEKVSETNDVIMDWMGQLSDAFNKKGTPASNKSSLLLYELNFSKSSEEIELSLFTARELKNGGYGKINRARANTVFNTYRLPEYFKEGDADNVLLFKTLCEGVKTSAILKGRLGALVLEGAIQTGRCFWKRGHTTPVTLAGSRTLKLRWDEQMGFSKLAFSLGNKSFLIGTDPLYYIDTSTKEVGLVETKLNQEQRELIKTSPYFSNTQLEEIVLELGTRIPQLEIETPGNLTLTELKGAMPKPILRLNKTSKGFDLNVAFAYEEHTVKALPFYSSMTLVAEKLKIWRDEEKERHLLHRLQDYGFYVDEGRLQAKNMSAWMRLMEDIAHLEESGFEIIQEPGFDLSFHKLTEVKLEVEPSSHWFEVGMHVMLDGQQLPLFPILSTLLNEGIDLEAQTEVCVPIEAGKYMMISTEIIKPIIKTFYELLDTPNSEGFKLHKYEAHIMDNFQAPGFRINDSTPLSQIAKELRDRPKLQTKAKGLQAELRAYQQEGIQWMQFMRRYGFGGILADDMGLGKTIQTLANLLIEKESQRQTKASLIIAPTSLLGNWKSEAQKFTPDLRVGIYYGKDRKNILDNINDYDVLITTYTLLTLDNDVLKKEHFYYLILDEAQKIKNARSESAKSAKQIRSEYSLALSGTPMENHLGELHSIFDTVMPGFLGNIKTFKSLYQNPIEKEHDIGAQRRLNERIRPFMLRRTKDKVAKELPAKTEMIRKVNFQKDQASLYETIRLSMEKSVRESIKNLGLAKSHISILAALLKLRQVCCDPRLLKIEQAQSVEESAKLQMLMELVEELREEKRRILIFSQFTMMLEIIEAQMIRAGIPYSKLTGSTRDRQAQIDDFNADRTEVFLISLKAGGVGLNLTQADTVIHYDPWWNPAAEEQATDRAYRIGQDKPVFVYKLIVENSVEEKILQMQEEKSALADAIYSEKEEGFTKMDAQDLITLFE